MNNSPYSHNTYVIRKKFFSLLGASFHIFDPQGQIAFYSKMKAFKLREDIRLYTGEDMQTEVLHIQARNIIDFSAAYDVVDSQTQEKVGMLKRKGMKSLFKDEWMVFNAHEQQIGTFSEDNLVFALMRRMVSNLIPQSFSGHVNNQTVCQFRQHFNPFILKMTLDFTPDPSQQLDRRLGIAAAILLCAIEGRQD
jgi:uncharacterized protein YxjI